jgi:hypothetical protein
MTATAKLNDRFDYITLQIRWADKSNLNFTRSRNGVKASGSAATREFLEFLDKWMLSRKGASIKACMETLLDAAARSCSAADFIARVPA